MKTSNSSPHLESDLESARKSSRKSSQKSIDVTRVMADRDALNRVSARNALRWGVLPLIVDKDTLHVVLADEENDNAIVRIESTTGLIVNVLPASDSAAVQSAIKRYYSTETSENTGTPLGLLEELVNRALQIRCSDIHIDPQSKVGFVRMRVDGVMRIDRELSLQETSELVSAIKVAAGLDISEKRIPQDGQITLFLLGEKISMRVATIPTINGEKVTLRILVTASIMSELSELDHLGMSEQHSKLFLNALQNPNGVILLSGPTGSGKTTTLYAALRFLKQAGDKHILSIEDPVEIPLDGINQVQVDSERVSFAGSLRSTLRHDPDIIMVGEIRDPETADIAVKSALTGHLVLSTIHANDAIGVITRLLNLGISPDMLASSIRMVIAQRLVRRPCEQCCEYREPDKDFLESLGSIGFNIPDNARVPEPKGCPLCAFSGYSGRLGVYEMVPFDKALGKLIRNNANEDDMAELVFEEHKLPTLKADVTSKMLQGLTTIDEMRRVILMGDAS